MKIGYARISTRDQNPDLQIDALKNAGCEDIYTEVASGGKSERPKLDEMLANLRKDDVLVIWKLDRLGRLTRHLATVSGEKQYNATPISYRASNRHGVDRLPSL